MLRTVNREPRILMNPPSALLGRTNAIIAGQGRHYDFGRFAGPLSIKCVIKGVATWETASGRYEMGPAGCLVLNDGEEYSLAIDSLRPVETFCVFFARGFVDDAEQTSTTPSSALLDRVPRGEPLVFAERLQSDPAIRNAILRARERRTDELALDASIHAIASALVASRAGFARRVASLPALRSATREEIARRLDRALSFIQGNLGEPLSIAAMASEACLSPFHFHRLFTSYFGQTPHRYVTRLRLERAAALLRGGDRDVVEVANACGFASAGSFTTLFAKTFGTPPARFRKNGEVVPSAPS